MKLWKRSSPLLNKQEAEIAEAAARCAAEEEGRREGCGWGWKPPRVASLMTL